MPKICSVLVVESHDGVRRVVGEALEADGYRFTPVENGAAMCRALDEAEHHIAIIDVSMRDEDGFELAKEAARRGLSVILTTADRSKFGAIERSGHKHVLKPYLLPHLLELVREVTQSQSLRCVRRKPRPA
jgi:DNA-binding NtrC family response regulator